MNGVRAKIDYLLKHNLAMQRAYKLLGSWAFRFVGLFQKTDEQLVLLSGHGRKFGDSPRVLFEAMRSDPRAKNLRYVWALEPGDATQIDGAQVVLADTPAYFLTALRARYWITCVNIERGLQFKKQGTTYLNTWHGTPMKTIGNAAGGRKDYDFSHIDYFCAAGEFEREIYLRDFGVRPESILMSGLPRNDELYHVTPERVELARERLRVPAGKKVILYAPTWRDSLDSGVSYEIKPPIDMKNWEAALGDEAIVFVRAHAYANKLMDIEYNDFVRDATDYPVMNDLLIAADILISDYSATIFDYAILERPIFCFAYDLDDYKKARGLYLDPDEVLPSGVVRDEEALLGAIRSIDYEAACADARALKHKYLTHGGHATGMCLDALLGSGQPE